MVYLVKKFFKSMFFQTVIILVTVIISLLFPIYSLSDAGGGRDKLKINGIYKNLLTDYKIINEEIVR
jgi:hypothetical protein